MNTINKVILMGNIGKEPEVKHLDSGKIVAKFPVATNENYRDKQGNTVHLTEWHNIEVWDEMAKLAEKYLKKGKMVYVEGKIRSNKYTDKETGVDKYIKYIKGDVLTFMNLNNNNNAHKTEKQNENATGSGNSEFPSVTSQGMTDDDLPF